MNRQQVNQAIERWWLQMLMQEISTGEYVRIVVAFRFYEALREIEKKLKGFL